MGSPEKSFSFAGGQFSPEEEEYLIKKGLMWETSCGEITDISTDLDDLSLSNLSLTSARDSLLLFEGNEQLFKELESPRSSSKSLSVSAGSSRKSQRPCSQSPQPMMTEIDLNASDDIDIDSSVSLFPDADDDDKENRAYIPQDDNEEYLFEDGIPETEDNVVVPGTQDIPLNDDDNNDQPSLAETSMDDIDIVPCTQGVSESFTSQTSETASVSANDSFEIVQCTQAPVEEETAENPDESSFEISSVPCSQESVGASSSKDNLDDTITVMTKLLAMADEQEAQEILDGKSENATENKNASSSSSHNDSSDSDKQQEVSTKIDNDNTKFRSPLKFNRVQMLKSRKMCTPSPPRSYVDTLLKHRNNMRKINVGTATTSGSKMQPPKTPVTTTQASSGRVHTSTPKRTPLANITPSAKKCLTPKVSKTPVAPKVDSGLRKSPFPVGLSPVANYIYSKPAPSTFARVHGTQQTSASTTNANFSSNPARSVGHATRIPIPPSRLSNVPNNPKTPGSSTKQGPRHTVLRTSTYFNMTTTPPQLIKNERAVASDGKKQFQPLRYTGTPKVKDVTGKFGSPKSEYVAQRHIGLRDESGNASFIQTTSIYKRPVPQQQSRLVAPQIRLK